LTGALTALQVRASAITPSIVFNGGSINVKYTI
jgi:hypothetical protein